MMRQEGLSVGALRVAKDSAVSEREKKMSSSVKEYGPIARSCCGRVEVGTSAPTPDVCP